MMGIAACGFESRLEGRWKLDPSTFSRKDLRRSGIPPELQSSFADGVFVADDGIVYLGAVHADTALVRYSVGAVNDDCADVKVTASDGAGNTESRTVEACLRGDQLQVSYEAGGKAIEVRLDRTQ
jgi:hypothetical protein